MGFIEKITDGLVDSCPNCGNHNWDHSYAGTICNSCGYEPETEEILSQMNGVETKPDGWKSNQRKINEYSDNIQNKIRDKQAEGWKPLQFQQDRVVMGKSSGGGLVSHFIIALLTVWWTFGFGNLLYYAYKKRQYNKTVLREDGNHSTEYIESPEFGREDAESLRSLERLFDEGLLSEEEYQTKRKELIERI